MTSQVLYGKMQSILNPTKSAKKRKKKKKTINKINEIILILSSTGS